jgi:hypothetical protein
MAREPSKLARGINGKLLESAFSSTSARWLLVATAGGRFSVSSILCFADSANREAPSGSIADPTRPSECSFHLVDVQSGWTFHPHLRSQRRIPATVPGSVLIGLVILDCAARITSPNQSKHYLRKLKQDWCYFVKVNYRTSIPNCS